MNKKTIAITVVVLLALLTGCRTAPVYEVIDAPVTVTSRNVSYNDMRTAIIRAGQALDWRMEPQGRGLIVGTLNAREHVAKVDIRYTPESYSILYRDSANLDYDGSSIHSRYNSWIERLDRAIQAQLVTM